MLMTLMLAMVAQSGEVADHGKFVVEQPIKKAIAEAPTAESGRVRPGLVRWHESPAAAIEAAAKSGRPVLLFQLLGRLDDAWC